MKIAKAFTKGCWFSRTKASILSEIKKYAMEPVDEVVVYRTRDNYDCYITPIGFKPDGEVIVIVKIVDRYNCDDMEENNII